MAAKSGSLSINSENIFPIIKKWLYSDHDIFYRDGITDDAMVVEKKTDTKVHLFEGSYNNIKITNPGDIKRAEEMIKAL